MKNRLPDPSEIRALDFEGEFRRFGIGSGAQTGQLASSDGGLLRLLPAAACEPLGVSADRHRYPEEGALIVREMDEMPENVLRTAAVTRRCLLASLLTAYTASLIPWALAQPVDNADQGAFLAISAILVGRRSLDAQQAKRLYDALKADDEGFPKMARELLALINDRKTAPLELQQVLDSEKSPLAGVPRKIAAAWFLGIVGAGAKARCLAYETALNAIIVSDVLKPPTYAYGVYGSWTAKPT